MRRRKATLKAVADFWEAEACGERYGDLQDQTRYRLEPEILTFANFPDAEGLRTLEIGVGMGSDFLRWSRAHAISFGIDLTHRALSITSLRLRDEGLTTRLTQADAEHLPFKDGSFDMVYSWGVLHHSPDTEVALEEAVRVLVPGGRMRLMLYHRHSWVALAAWVRFALLGGRPLVGLRKAISYMESPGTKAFTAQEIGQMLGHSLEQLRVSTALTHWDRKWAPGLARLAGNRFGWFLLVDGRKMRVSDPGPNVH
jgi:ubiquinone/menaquinone biosynthesis C-methylase UbiE